MISFWDKFSDIVKYYPHHIALQEGAKKIDYQNLHDQAIQLATVLDQKHQFVSEDLIALQMPKSIEYIVALLASWYTGAAFIPLPPCLPQERMDFICAENDIKCFITQQDVQAILQNPPIARPHKVKKISANSLAYLIYTSGSTGQPKGVLVEHKGIVNFLEEQITAFQFNASSRSLFYLSINFDASLSDIGVALLSGAMLIIETDNVLKDGALFLKALHQHKITHTDIPPSLLRIFDPEQMPLSLQTIIIGGEASDPKVIRHWASRLRVINVYGPTETTVCTSLNICDPQTWHKALIGVPFKNTHYYVFDQNLNPTSFGQSGELYIGGLQVARGYQNQPELTAQKFIKKDGEILYKTGDRVVQHNDHEFEFIARLDRQFKIRGQLVEPDEIEAHLKQRPDIFKASVIKRPFSANKDDVLIAFITAPQRLKPEDLKKQLAQTLPSWMVPQYIIQLSQMPLTTTGKIDTAALKNRPLEKNTSRSELIEPQNPQQQRIFDLFSNILKHHQFSITDSFFTIGGDSLKVMDLTLSAQKYQLDISPSLLVNHPTVIDLDCYLSNTAANKDTKSGALSAKTLKRDVAFDTDFQSLFTVAKTLPLAASDTDVFLTGATGFLGSRLLAELLKNTDQNIMCLVRAKNTKDGLKRIIQTLQKYHVPYPSKDLHRIKLICGDLSQEYFGLASSDFLTLSKNVGTIYHCAAWVNMIHNYQTMRPANVSSCFEIVRLACTSIKKHIHYASTLSVFVATDQNTGLISESDRLENTKMIYGGYAQTKWAAEYMMLQIPKHACSISHYRFGLITGDSKLGHSADADFLSLFSRGLKKLGVVPKPLLETLFLDITPIDYAAKAMALLSFQGSDDIYHIANSKSISLGQWVTAMQHNGINIKAVTSNEWHVACSKDSLTLEERAAYLALCRGFQTPEKFEKWRTMDLFQATDVTFDTQNSTSVLKDFSLSCPPADQNMLKIYLDHIFCDKTD